MAYVFTRYGGPETGALTDVERLSPGPGRLLAAVRAAGVDGGGSRVARARTAAVLDAVTDLVPRGALNPHVTGTFPPARAEEAPRAVENGHTRGKILIEVVA